MRIVFALIFLLLAGAAPVLAAAAPAKPDQPIMRVMVVRSSAIGCEPKCTSWISAEGRITAQTPALFRAVLKSIGNAKMPIVISSGGGDVDGALAIGRMIRQRRLDVVVGRTVFDSCPTDRKGCDEKAGRGLSGSPVGYEPFCASACSFVLAAGTRRLVPTDSYVGVHQIVSFTTFVKRLQTFSVRRRLVEGVPVEINRRLVRERVVSKVTRQVPTRSSMYDKLARYFQEMGISEDINPLMRSAVPESMHWLTRTELAKTGMATDALAAYQIIDEANKALRPPSPPPPPPPQLSADGWVDGGRFRDKDITLIVRFTWMRGGGSIGVSATALKPASQRGITIAPVEFNVTLRPGSARERALIPRSFETAPTLFGHMTRVEFCQLRKDPMLRVAVLPGTLEGVEPRTMYVGVDGFQGMGPMLDDVCRNVETAAAGP